MSYDYESFSELVHARRSIRKLKPDPLPEGAVEKILECGRWAMNGGNAQPWEFIVITDPETKTEMARTWDVAYRAFKVLEFSRVPEIRHPVFSRPEGLPNWHNAPAFIGIIGDRRKMQVSVLHPGFYGSEGGDGIGPTFYKDLGNVAQIMHLAACSLGLGSEWLSIERNLEQQWKRLLNIPDDLELHSLVILGYPDMAPPPGYRRELEKLVHYEKYNYDLYSTTEDVRNMILDSRKSVRAAEGAAYKIKPVGE